MSIRINTKGLEKLKAQWASPPVIKVGILSPEADRNHQNSDVTLATLGFLHEFGYLSNVYGKGALKEVPARSFIRMPLSRPRMAYLLKQFAKGFVKGKSKKETEERIGLYSIGEIEGAFATGGFGLWKRLSSFTQARRREKGNDSNQVLVDTAELRESITWGEYDGKKT